MALGAVLPFELTAPVARVGPLEVSSVELFLYLALALWAVAVGAEVLSRRGREAPAPRSAKGATSMPLSLRAQQWFGRLTPAHLAVAAWALVNVAAAAAAPFDRPTAIKFALRSLGGVALCFAAADLLRTPQAVWRAAAGIAAGACVAALAIVGEAHFPGGGGLLRGFHSSTFQASGLIRASGPFQYPNIAAMYLEAAIPVLIAVGLVAATRVTAGARRSRRPSGGQVATVLAALLLVEALVLTASRTGLVAVAAVLVGLVIRQRLHRGRRAPPRPLAGVQWACSAVLIGLAVLTVIGPPGGSPRTLGFLFSREGTWYRAAIESAPAPEGDRRSAISLAPAETTTMKLLVENRGAAAWPRSGPRPVRVSYHWYQGETGKLVTFDGVRTPLPHDVAPGGRVELDALVRAPRERGRYLLEWDLVQEGVAWFRAQGDADRLTAVDVETATGGNRTPARWLASVADREQVVDAPGKLDEIPRRTLWRAGLSAFREHPLLGLGPDQFRHVYGRYLGLAKADDRLHANNLYVETLANLGIAGILALAALIAVLAGSARRTLRSHRVAPAGKLMVLGLGAGLAAYLAHGVLDYFLEFTPTYGLMWLLAGMLIGLGREEDAATQLRGPEGAPPPVGSSAVGESKK
jgi:hypothetical protein